ncbi:MAG: single-stranded DNA-binding protein [Defluviicoccus sp.]|nr:single-stranded DNA-binding protein [Defluviicoccus sp.]
MLTVNRATLVGHVGRDPEIRSLPNGGRAAAFSLATSEKWTDREGKPTEATEWHRVVVYGASVEIVEAMLRKGDPVMVEGRSATRKYSDREGTERSVTEIVVAGPQGMVNVLSPRKAEEGSATATGTPE